MTTRDNIEHQADPVTMRRRPFVITTVPSQIVRLEPVISEVMGGGTAAVVIRGADAAVPEGAVLVVPSASSTGA